MTNEETQLNPSYTLIAGVEGMSTNALQELWETLTPDNVQEFLDLIGTVLQEREEQHVNRPRYTKD